MGPRREASIHVRKFILRLFKKGISYREIAKIVGRSHSCVQKIIGRFKSDGLIENKSGRGRKSMLSDVAKRKVLKDIRIDPKLSVVKLAAETSRIIGRCVSAETVRNLIRHAGYSSRVARKKPFISLQKSGKRLEFTKTHQLKTDNFWKKVIFSDESKFNFLEVMAVAPFGESRTPFWIQKIDVLQLNMVVTPSWFRLYGFKWDNLVALHFKYDQARRRFVEWAQNEIAVVPDFHKRILFSDEAHFWLNGYVNKQNCRIWSEANPQVYVETPLHPEKLTVWCALWAGRILLQKR
ncbi:HTH_Tnp_Tc3_2 domain-containing protein [Trichonephila clavipes]|nr:HTH_Tnp_Tc3_2 domain-containing protein [Trichonephila clavipes]